jgi:hypothetical protein
MTAKPAAMSTEQSALEEAAIPSCALTSDGRNAQRARIERLGLAVAGVRRGEDRMTIDFEPGFDQQLLGKTLAVERGCCPFLRFSFDQPTRQLTVSVEAPEHRAGLHALARALGA